MTPYQAAVKSFHDCRLSHQNIHSVASYLARQRLIAAGATVLELRKAMPEVESKLDQWFAELIKNPSFSPGESEQAADQPTIDDSTGLLMQIES